MLLATIVMAGFVLMPNVYATGLTVNAYKQVTDITNSGHPNGEWTPVENSSSEKDAVFVYDAANLKVIDEAKDGGDRPVDDAAWIGLLIEAPTEIEGGVVNPYWLGSFKPENQGKYVPFEKETEGDYADKYTIWVPITAQELQEVVEADGEDAELVRSYTIRWGGENDEENVQTITVKIKASGVTLVADPAPAPGQEVDADAATWDNEDYEAAVEAYTVAHTIPEEDKGPDTADTNVYGLFAIILASGLGLGYVVRKRMN